MGMLPRARNWRARCACVLVHRPPKGNYLQNVRNIFKTKVHQGKCMLLRGSFPSLRAGKKIQHWFVHRCMYEGMSQQESCANEHTSGLADLEGTGNGVGVGVGVGHRL